MMEAVIFMAASVNRIELKAQGRPNLANGISLYVSDDRKVATWSLAGCKYVHGKQLVWYELGPIGLCSCYADKVGKTT